jgi:hypothetical protein
MQSLSSRYWLGGLGFVLLAGLFVAFPLSAFDDDDDAGEEEIAVDELPEAIREALAGVEIEDADRTVRGDRVIFEVAIEVDDAEIELQLTQNARLVGVEVDSEEDEDDDSDDSEVDDSDDRDDDDSDDDDSR